MGWSRGMENGREIGYGVDAECDVPGCSVEIDRGLAYRCGGVRNLQDDKPGCGAYVCDQHNFLDSCEICDPSDNGHAIAPPGSDRSITESGQTGSQTRDTGSKETQA